MQDIWTRLTALTRPRLLIRAARIGAEEYRRTPQLRRLLGMQVPGTGAALLQLLEIEQELDQSRRHGDAAYSVQRHVEVLIALVAEARLYRAGLCTALIHS
ncbi:DUF6477 family protein [Pseudooceanicola nanhaiensis]|uniref:DUF6477 family protein n=1 Tax=Pseudooceanicola nanhaiensis TaxID=375761 RepID=UPI001CD21F14|nr:DUF6477 family protein [Pseudooceanicola nanhaiensis]MCA0921581.1 DUF6477 family protein [Pseudooceanicola nanhaiensis]